MDNSSSIWEGSSTVEKNSLISRIFKWKRKKVLSKAGSSIFAEDILLWKGNLIMKNKALLLERSSSQYMGVPLRRKFYNGKMFKKKKKTISIKEKNKLFFMRRKVYCGKKSLVGRQFYYEKLTNFTAICISWNLEFRCRATSLLRKHDVFPGKNVIFWDRKS